jgi:hypothetical protein
MQRAQRSSWRSPKAPLQLRAARCAWVSPVDDLRVGSARVFGRGRHRGRPRISLIVAGADVSARGRSHTRGPTEDPELVDKPRRGIIADRIP